MSNGVGITAFVEIQGSQAAPTAARQVAARGIAAQRNVRVPGKSYIAGELENYHSPYPVL